MLFGQVVEPASIGVKVGMATTVAAAAQMSIEDPVFSPLLILAALCGSVSAEMYRLVNTTDPPAGRLWRRAFKGLAVFLLGFLFGYFIGPSVADNTPLDPMGAVFSMALMGYGIMQILLSQKMLKAAASFLLERLERKS